MKLLTLLDVVSQAALEIGITQSRVSTVVSSMDQDIIQMRSLLSAVADDVLLEEPYRETLGDQNWIVDSDGAPKDNFTSDNDFIRFDGRLAVNGLKWRFLAGKGLEFGETLRDYTSRLNTLAARANQRVLDLDIDPGRVQ